MYEMTLDGMFDSMPKRKLKLVKENFYKGASTITVKLLTNDTFMKFKGFIDRNPAAKYIVKFAENRAVRLTAMGLAALTTGAMVMDPSVALADELAVEDQTVAVPDAESVQTDTTVENTTVTEESELVDELNDDAPVESTEEVAVVSEEQLTDEQMQEEQEAATQNEEQTGEYEPVTKENQLEVSDVEVSENPDVIDVPVKTDTHNGFSIIQNADGTMSALFSPDDKMSYDELAAFIANFNETQVSDIVVRMEDLKILGINPDHINGPVDYDLTEYGLGYLEISMNEDGTYSIIPDGTADIRVATGYMGHSYANDLDPDDDVLNWANKAQPDPEPEPEPEPEPDKPDEPEPDEPEPDEPEPEPEKPDEPEPEEPEPIIPEEPQVPTEVIEEIPVTPDMDLAQTGDDLQAMMLMLTGVAGTAATVAGYAGHKLHNTEANTSKVYSLR